MRSEEGGSWARLGSDTHEGATLVGAGASVGVEGEDLIGPTSPFRGGGGLLCMKGVRETMIEGVPF